MIGLRRGTVSLCEHDDKWKELAEATIRTLKDVLGSVAVEIQHVGSTSIAGIKAKPIIDIAVAVNNFDDVKKLIPQLEAAGFYFRSTELKLQLLFVCGDYSIPDGIQTHFIHVVKANSQEYRDYINFRDFLNENYDKAKEYEDLKMSLAEKYSVDPGREHYLKGKENFIKYTLRKALVWSYLGKCVDVIIDRPMGYVHRKENYSLTYPINYGYIEGVIGGDGEELDVYVLGVRVPLEAFTGKIIAIVHRNNDVEDKLVAAPAGMSFTKHEIEAALHFQEQYYDSVIEMQV